MGHPNDLLNPSNRSKTRRFNVHLERIIQLWHYLHNSGANASNPSFLFKKAGNKVPSDPRNALHLSVDQAFIFVMLFHSTNCPISLGFLIPRRNVILGWIVLFFCKNQNCNESRPLKRELTEPNIEKRYSLLLTLMSSLGFSLMDEHTSLAPKDCALQLTSSPSKRKSRTRTGTNIDSGPPKISVTAFPTSPTITGFSLFVVRSMPWNMIDYSRGRVEGFNLLLTTGGVLLRSRPWWAPRIFSDRIWISGMD